MKNLKKLLCLLLALMMVFSLFACAAEDDFDDDDDEDEDDEEISETADGTDDTDDTDDTDGTDGTGDATTPEDDKPIIDVPVELPTDTVKGFDNAVLMDQNGVKIKGVEIVASSYSYTLTFEVENTTDTDLKVMFDFFAVNGMMMDASLYTEVAAKSSVQADSYIFVESLKDCGINNIGTMTMAFWVIDENFDVDFTSETVNVKISDDNSATVSVNANAKVAYNEQGLKITVSHVMDIDIYGKAIYVLVENTGSKKATVSVWNLSVNGAEVVGIGSTDVAPGMHAILTVCPVGEDYAAIPDLSISSAEINFALDVNDKWFTTDPVSMTF